MTVRYYVCPMDTVTVGPRTFRRPRVAAYPSVGWAIADNNGTWCFAYVDADDFTSFDADPQCNNVLETLADLTGVTSPRQMRQYLAGRTLGEIPAAQRTRIQNKLTAGGVDLTGLTLQSTWEDLLLRIHRTLCPGAALQDLGVSR